MTSVSNAVTTVTTGLAQADLHTLRILNNSGVMQNILDVIAASSGGGGGGGGSGAVTSATAPLSIDGSGVLSIDLGQYATNSSVANKLDGLTGGGAVVLTGSGSTRTITVDLDP